MLLGKLAGNSLLLYGCHCVIVSLQLRMLLDISVLRLSCKRPGLPSCPHV